MGLVAKGFSEARDQCHSETVPRRLVTWRFSLNPKRRVPHFTIIYETMALLLLANAKELEMRASTLLFALSFILMRGLTSSLLLFLAHVAKEAEDGF